MLMDPRDIANRFTFHPADTAEKRFAHEDVRAHFLALAEYLNEKLPSGREKSLAITELEKVMFWANAAIARQP
jgi:hypothetical protein